MNQLVKAGGMLGRYLSTYDAHVTLGSTWKLHESRFSYSHLLRSTYYMHAIGIHVQSAVNVSISKIYLQKY